MGLHAIFQCACQQSMRTLAPTCVAGADLQASRVRFIFRDDELEVALGEAQEKTENSFVGGENVWKFCTFTNWEFWWPNFPVLVYFKVSAPQAASRSLLLTFLLSVPCMRITCMMSSYQSCVQMDVTDTLQSVWHCMCAVWCIEGMCACCACRRLRQSQRAKYISSP